MRKGTRGTTGKYLAIGALFIWLILNMLTLTAFPALHSDEAWLSGLSMEMIQQGRPDVTEPFFDLYPRHPHALKLIYHFLQIPFLLTGGYDSFSARILSLAAAFFSLLLFYGLLKDLEKKGYSGFTMAPPAAVFLLALDIQFITAAHTGRQESLLLLVQLLIIRLYLRTRGAATAMFTGLVTGLAVGIHPNAFILAWTPGLLLLNDVIFRRRKPAAGLFFLAGGVLGASVFVLLSFLFNPDFIHDYLAYGSPLGVTRGLDEKILQLPRFLTQIYSRIAGTYYLPDLRLQILIFPLILIPSLFFSFKRFSESLAEEGPASQSRRFADGYGRQTGTLRHSGKLDGHRPDRKIQPALYTLSPALFLHRRAQNHPTSTAPFRYRNCRNTCAFPAVLLNSEYHRRVIPSEREREL